MARCAAAASQAASPPTGTGQQDAAPALMLTASFSFGRWLHGRVPPVRCLARRQAEVH